MTIKDRLRKLTYSFDSRKVMEATIIPEIERLERDLAKARSDALEEAAKIAERHFIPFHSVAGPAFSAACANTIRALKEKP